MAHLVDTDVLIDLATNNQGAIVYVNSLAEGWSVSIITALELIVGARDKKEITKIDKADGRPDRAAHSRSRDKGLSASQAILQISWLALAGRANPARGDQVAKDLRTHRRRKDSCGRRLPNSGLGQHELEFDHFA
jgi:hypothetical protein